MIDLHSVVAFFHRAKWTEPAIRHIINHVLGENTISYSTVRKYVRMFPYSTKETGTPMVPESKVGFSLDDCIPLCFQRSHFFKAAKLLRM
jgi:hypothetical protein